MMEQFEHNGVIHTGITHRKDARMQRLIGDWEGLGTATLPDMDDTLYHEILSFLPHGDDPILKVEQKTWRVHPDQSESLLYWETGFLRQVNETTCQWINAQNNGRTEVLYGEIIFQHDGLSLDLNSVAYSNDTKMIASRRQLQVSGQQLTYQTSIATQKHPMLQPHLVAQLQHK